MIFEREQEVIINSESYMLYGNVMTFNPLTNMYMIRVKLNNYTRVYNFKREIVRRFIVPKKEVEELILA